MAVVSVRFNKQEEQMLEYLTEHFEEDKSSLIKHSLQELFEDLKDREFIDKFEKSKLGKTKFVSSKDIFDNFT